MLIRGCLLVVLMVLGSMVPGISNAFGTETPAVLTNLHWTTPPGPGFSDTCLQVTDLRLDVTGALNTGTAFGLHGRFLCNTASGQASILTTGTAVITASGLLLSLYAGLVRVECTLSMTTLSSSACTITDVATKNFEGTFSLTYAP